MLFISCLSLTLSEYTFALPLILFFQSVLRKIRIQFFFDILTKPTSFHRKENSSIILAKKSIAFDLWIVTLLKKIISGDEKRSTAKDFSASAMIDILKTTRLTAIAEDFSISITEMKDFCKTKTSNDTTTATTYATAQTKISFLNQPFRWIILNCLMIKNRTFSFAST